MALNVTPGSGAVVKTDTVSSEHVQNVKLTFGAVDTATLVASTAPLPVAASGYTVVKNIAMTCTASILAADEVIADTQQLDAALRITNGTGLLQSLTVIDKDDQGAAIRVFFLSGNVTVGTENAAMSISDTNAENILGFVDVLASDYVDMVGVRVANIRGVGLPLVAVTGTDDIYVAVVNGAGTPTYSATGLFLRLGILQD